MIRRVAAFAAIARLASGASGESAAWIEVASMEKRVVRTAIVSAADEELEAMNAMNTKS